MLLQSINPATNQTIKAYESHSPQEVQQKIEQTQQAWKNWRLTDMEQRKELLTRLAAVLRKHRESLAVLMANEMGKPIKQGLAEVEKSAHCCAYYAANAAAQLQDMLIPTEAARSYASFQPLGIVLAVMPWNFPFWQVFRFLAPALAAGNAALLKHASNVPGCALAIEALVKEAGFPPQLFQTLLIGSKEVEKVLEHPYVKAATLTGSTPAGKQVAQKAGSLLKKVVLELGGSDPYIILKDADLELAAEACVTSRLINSGQSCIAAKRFIVEASVQEAFTRLFVEKMQARKMGDPLNPATDIGPQARTDLRDELHSQVTTSIEKGAVCLLGGILPPGNHAYYPPTVLTHVQPGMPAYEEELFGPVAAIITAKDEADAIRIANDTIFGLGAAVFTNDSAKGEHIARTQLDAGACFVNSFVQSDPRLPFGGIKESGFGRELGLFGIREFVNIKTISVRNY
ncbi:NAD-dependent succinate-semialdehyde dehydrogenase [Flavihumibacter sp. CACIAM 22H1]|uniref:NAD-dependent succinate-semialdehyde dehydrogenase n=1 Tax=Flavihumibacter sp. CACIAM 22H1 TaxID=1812911 RepID=UPI0007A861CD|nr:NAD-dependent succinate-semialdehyde dehydrogenase [Flavihumibacter sp. CACIAM 22H1]KYP16180.1 MAG: succinate-semialdehyde dehydrogenase [Flavihumibacter sp. CACIAM 22H1]